MQNSLYWGEPFSKLYSRNKHEENERVLHCKYPGRVNLGY